MKKILFATSALVASGLFAGTAQAQDSLSLSVGGFMEHWYGYASQESDLTEVDANRDGVADGEDQGGIHAAQDVEIHFDASTTLDNGIEVSARVELEGNQSDDQIDEMWLAISGGFGEVILGNDDVAGDKLHVSPPSSGFISYDDSDIEQWLVLPGENRAGDDGDGIDTYDSYVGDARKITYITPSISGFQLGASFTPQRGFEHPNANGNRSAAAHNGFSMAGAYEGEFSGVSLAASLGWETIELANNVRANAADETASASFWAAGLNIGFDAFTLGVAYSDGDDNVDGNDDEFTTYSIGLGYSFGAASVSIGYGYAEAEDGTSGLTTVQKDKDEAEQYELGASYEVGPGITWQSSIAFVSYDGDNLNAAGGDVVEKADGWVVGTGLALDF